MNWLTSVSDNFKGRIGNLVNDHRVDSSNVIRL